MRNLKHLLAGIGALIVALLMICGPGACHTPLLYMLGWLAYIPLATYALIPLIDKIGVSVDRAIREEERTHERG